MSFGETLKQKMPINTLKAYCGVCDGEFYHSHKGSLHTPTVAGDIIEMQAEAHRNKTDHDDLQIDIDKSKKPEKIDFTINE